jgi:predicted secreted Zn-dependent protease
MKTALKRLSTSVAAAAATTALVAAILPGTANAQVIVQWYSYTSAGARSCNNAANAAGPEYYCTTVTVAGRKMYALARP